MATSKSVVLITGANAGIGFELAKQLLSDPLKHVIVGSRSAEKGEAAVKDLESRHLPGSLELLQVDVGSEASVAAAAKEVQNKHGKLDVLVNNAGIALPPGSIAQQMAECFQINATGPWIMGEAFAPLLQKSTGTPRVVNVSSGVGSITKRLDTKSPTYSQKAVQYRASKTALNMVTACQSVDYGEFGAKVFAYCPGFTQSNLSAHNNAEGGAKPTSEGAAPMVKIINGEHDVDHGKFLNGGGYFPW